MVQPRIETRKPRRFTRRHDSPLSSSEESGSDTDSEEDGSGDEEDESDGSDVSEELDGEDGDDADEVSGGQSQPESEVDDAINDPQRIPKDCPSRGIGFKAWALKQMGRPDDTITTSPALAPSKSVSHRPSTALGPLVGPLGSITAASDTTFLNTSSSSKRPVISRRPSVADSRMDLPILAEEQSIIETILLNPVVVICGETGSGKTTQVPQMLYEAGFGFPDSDNPGMIAVTQPRRVAAVSLAARVKDELNLPRLSGIVAHQIRYSSTTSPETAIKFMTDGVLLRELATDFLLSRYSVVVVDEAHERGINTDVLVGVLSRVARLREKKWRDPSDSVTKPLRIVIMSATLRVDDFVSNSTLFASPPPVIRIDARQHPVTIHFSRRTVSDYVNEAYRKICKIHARLPAGGVLVFMTGQAEITGLCRKLEKRYGVGNKLKTGGSSGVRGDVVEEAEEVDLGGEDDLAADVDDGLGVSDSEALDSENEGLGIDIDEPTDGESYHI